MPADKLFGTKELIKALKRLRLKPKKQVGSSHQIWQPNTSKKPIHGQRPFVTVIQNKKQFCKKTCNGYYRELIRLGYTIEEVNEAFNN